jgi:hypothetical protein
MVSGSRINTLRFMSVGLNMVYTLGSSMVTGIKRESLSGRWTFTEFELGVIFLKRLSIYQRKLIFRCSIVGSTPASTSNSSWLRSPPPSPSGKPCSLKHFSIVCLLQQWSQITLLDGKLCSLKHLSIVCPSSPQWSHITLFLSLYLGK